MMLSTVWLAVGFVLSIHGQPLTAAIVTLPWFLHHRWEEREEDSQISLFREASTKDKVIYVALCVIGVALFAGLFLLR